MKKFFTMFFPTRTTKILFALYVITFIWWLTIFGRGIENTTESFLFDIPLGLIPIITAAVAIYQAKKNKEKLERFLYLGSISLACAAIVFGLGSLSWLYYAFVLKNIFPYPSYADVFYVLCNPFIIAGVAFQVRAAGMWSELRRCVSLLGFFVIPIVAITGLYYFLFFIAKKSTIQLSFSLKELLDLWYSVGDIVTLLLLAVLLFGLVFHKIRSYFVPSVLVMICAFVLSYFVDLGFAYETTRGTYYIGSYIDMMYLATFFLVAYSANLFSVISAGDK